VEYFFPIQQALWGASLIAQTLLLLRLLQQGLLRRYPFFAGTLMAEAVCGVMATQLTFDSRAYAEAFRTYTLIIAVLRVGFAGELYERICEHFPGIGKFRVGLASLLVLIAAIGAVGLFRPDLAVQWAFPQTAVTVIRRFQGEIFAVVFIFAWIFFRYVLSIQQPFRPNVLNHWRIATIYFGVSGAHALAILFAGRGPIVYPINSAMLAADIGCFVAWTCLMRRAGEQLPWFQRLSPSEIEAVERRHQDLLETVTSLPRAISDRLTEN
jgi:hypothetical protein